MGVFCQALHTVSRAPDKKYWTAVTEKSRLCFLDDPLDCAFVYKMLTVFELLLYSLYQFNRREFSFEQNGNLVCHEGLDALAKEINDQVLSCAVLDLNDQKALEKRFGFFHSEPPFRISFRELLLMEDFSDGELTDITSIPFSFEDELKSNQGGLFAIKESTILRPATYSGLKNEILSYSLFVLLQKFNEKLSVPKDIAFEAVKSVDEYVRVFRNRFDIINQIIMELIKENESTHAASSQKKSTCLYEIINPCLVDAVIDCKELVLNAPSIDSYISIFCCRTYGDFNPFRAAEHAGLKDMRKLLLFFLESDRLKVQLCKFIKAILWDDSVQNLHILLSRYFHPDVNFSEQFSLPSHLLTQRLLSDDFLIECAHHSPELFAFLMSIDVAFIIKANMLYEQILQCKTLKSYALEVMSMSFALGWNLNPNNVMGIMTKVETIEKDHDIIRILFDKKLKDAETLQRLALANLPLFLRLCESDSFVRCINFKLLPYVVSPVFRHWIGMNFNRLSLERVDDYAQSFASRELSQWRPKDHGYFLEEDIKNNKLNDENVVAYKNSSCTLGELFNYSMFGEFGYYSSRINLASGHHDYSTYPIKHKEFSSRMAELVYSYWRTQRLASLSEVDEEFVVLEVGAGEGQLCKGFLSYCQSQGRTDNEWARFYSCLKYWIVEKSHFLFEKQRDILRPFSDKIEHFEGDALNLRAVGLPKKADVALSNELLDVFPPERIVLNSDGTVSLITIVPSITREALSLFVEVGDDFFKESELFRCQLSNLFPDVKISGFPLTFNQFKHLMRKFLDLSPEVRGNLFLLNELPVDIRCYPELLEKIKLSDWLSDMVPGDYKHITPGLTRYFEGIRECSNFQIMIDYTAKCGRGINGYDGTLSTVNATLFSTSRCISNSSILRNPCFVDVSYCIDFCSAVKVAERSGLKVVSLSHMNDMIGPFPNNNFLVLITQSDDSILVETTLDDSAILYRTDETKDCLYGRFFSKYKEMILKGSSLPKINPETWSGSQADIVVKGHSVLKPHIAREICCGRK